jgi:hypothetical protein
MAPAGSQEWDVLGIREPDLTNVSASWEQI